MTTDAYSQPEFTAEETHAHTLDAIKWVERAEADYAADPSDENDRELSVAREHLRDWQMG